MLQLYPQEQGQGGGSGSGRLEIMSNVLPSQSRCLCSQLSGLSAPVSVSAGLSGASASSSTIRWTLGMSWLALEKLMRVKRCVGAVEVGKASE